MEISIDTSLSAHGYTFVRITKCKVSAPRKTFSGVQISFAFTISPTSLIVEGSSAVLEKLAIDLHLKDGTDYLYIGRLKNKFIQSIPLSYERERDLQIEFRTDDFWKLVDITHYKDLELKLEIQARLKLEEPIKNSSGGEISGSELQFLEGNSYLRFPHSEWLKILNRTGIERFDLITLRTYIRELPNENAFVQAFDKLKEAQDKFNRGDWNAVGATCRSAFKTLLHLATGEKRPIQKLLATVLDDPRRTQIANSLVPVLDVLNASTHQEGKSDLPPADFQREDALLCLHLTGAAISYIATVYK
jgi:hypothetical protein